MLLRSSSTPIMNCPSPWLSSHYSFPELDLSPHTLKLSRTSSSSPSSSSSSRKCTCMHGLLSAIPGDEEKEKVKRCETMVGGDGCGGGGRRICGGGGGGGGGAGDGDGNGGFENWDPNQGSESTDLYYKKMIEANPGNSLLLGNYARFLKEVKGDLIKAEEYCSRSILANPSDGSELALYADLLWQSHKDSLRAETYFNQAIKAAPNDCYVLASYAHFLWDAEEEEEEEECKNENEERQDMNNIITRSKPSLVRGKMAT